MDLRMFEWTKPFNKLNKKHKAYFKDRKLVPKFYDHWNAKQHANELNCLNIHRNQWS